MRVLSRNSVKDTTLSDGMRRRDFLRQTAGLALTACLLPRPAARAQSGNSADSANTATATPDRAWPSFRNGNELRGIAGSDLPAKLKLQWKVPVQDGVTATAAIVGDHVFAGTYGGELICLERATGKRVWTYFSQERRKPTDFIPGFQASPTVTGDLVVLGDEDGVFHAVERSTGKLRWKFETMAEIIASAVIVGDRVIFGSYDYTLYCLTAADGKVVWKFETQDRINGSPAVAGDLTFVTGCDQHLRAIHVQEGTEVFDLPLERFLIASPAVLGDMLYVGTHEGEFLAIDLAGRDTAWSFRDGDSELPIHSSAALTDQVVVFGGQDKKLHCLDRATGKQKWAFDARGQINSSPVIVGNDRVFVGSNDGNLYEVGLSDGRQRWKEKLGRSVSASPAVGEGCLVIGAEGTEGEIFCFA